MRSLPPFPELVAFEAVARLQSFTRAAAELCITQSAVSHRVRRLEKHFGTQLIRRMNPGIALTDAGAALLPELQTALDHLGSLGPRRERKLRVAAGSALCAWWLAGRLPAFMRLRPGISIELVPIENESSTIPEVDVRILWVGEGDDGATATQAPLFNEWVFPVCSPQLLSAGRSARGSGQIDGLVLLHKTSHAAGEWSWKVWADRLGMDKRRGGGELRFADMGLVMSAAVDGAGVALVRSLLAHDALRDGRLVVPFANFEPMTSSKKHVARWRRARSDDPDIKSFVTWLTAEAQQTLTATQQYVRSEGESPKVGRTQPSRASQRRAAQR